MKYKGIRIHFNELIFLVLLAGVVLLEFQVHIIERGIGLYLRWGNSERSQLGRVWDRDRQNVLARNKIENLLTTQDSHKETSEAFRSLDQIYEKLFPGSSQVISREKFLELYYNYPGEWSGYMASPLDLIEIDADKNWDRVLFDNRAGWVNLSFLDRENHPIREFNISISQLEKLQSNRSVTKGTLEELDFSEDRLFPFHRFVPILRTLDSDSRRVLFPDPQWFLLRNYHITRIGFAEAPFSSSFTPQIMIGIEYQTEFYPHVLSIMVPMETAHNILSQIEKGQDVSGGNPDDSMGGMDNLIE